MLIYFTFEPLNVISLEKIQLLFKANSCFCNQQFVCYLHYFSFKVSSFLFVAFVLSVSAVAAVFLANKTLE